MIEVGMLSRVAGNLFWIGRFVDRSTNVARLADAARRIEAIPGPVTLKSSEWASALIAAGVRPKEEEAFGVSRAEAVYTLFRDKTNPSSVISCFQQARENARSVRVDLSQEVWEAINDTWLDFSALCAPGSQFDLERAIGDVKGDSARIRGSINETLMRNDGFYFVKLGQAIERIDSMARLVDVKYHVLLPDAQDVGSSQDRTQWNALLWAASAQRAYSYATKSDISARGVAQFLLLSAEFPRSIRFNVGQLLQALTALERYYEFEADCRADVIDFTNWIEKTDVDALISRGLHESLTDIVTRNHQIADAIASSYGFGGPRNEEATLADARQEQN